MIKTINNLLIIHFLKLNCNQQLAFLKQLFINNESINFITIRHHCVKQLNVCNVQITLIEKTVIKKLKFNTMNFINFKNFH